jgi:hypothetical protein
MEAVTACDSLVINDGDNIGKTGPVEPCLTICKVLRAVSTIQCYSELSSKSSFRNLESMLFLFSHHLHLEEQRALKTTQITQYFACQ